MPKTGEVFNTKSYTVDLDDGRILEPSGTAKDVKLGNPHNKALIDSGTLVVTSETGKDDDEATVPTTSGTGTSAAGGSVTTSTAADAGKVK